MPNERTAVRSLRWPELALLLLATTLAVAAVGINTKGCVVSREGMVIYTESGGWCPEAAATESGHPLCQYYVKVGEDAAGEPEMDYRLLHCDGKIGFARTDGGLQ